MSSPCLGDYFTKLSWRNSVMWLIGPTKRGGGETQVLMQLYQVLVQWDKYCED